MKKYASFHAQPCVSKKLIAFTSLAGLSDYLFPLILPVDCFSNFLGGCVRSEFRMILDIIFCQNKLMD